MEPKIGQAESQDARAESQDARAESQDARAESAPLAAAERWLNRAWSAAADGHRPECLSSLAEALSSAREAEAMGRERFHALG